MCDLYLNPVKYTSLSNNFHSGFEINEGIFVLNWYLEVVVRFVFGNVGVVIINDVGVVIVSDVGVEIVANDNKFW